MAFDINKYRPKKKRSFWRVLKLRFKLWKHKRRNKKTNIKKFFGIMLLLFIILIVELGREENYLKYRILTVPFYFKVFDNSIIVEGNYLTKSFTKGETFSRPYITRIECNFQKGNCIEYNVQELLGAYIPSTSEYFITSFNKNKLEAKRETGLMLFTLSINFNTEEVLIHQEPLRAKTDYRFLDVGTANAVTKIVDDYTFRREFYKHYLDIINTPIRYILRF
ncbi:MAG: hypothetical protein NC408_04480 [Candidatus Gastranaerophilales bacterium]|nr:hypothetical protein [Candidatus Gastranaerophilales bacterium]MCM1072272.1 hypothetical protein [Bacteroides sp.]